MIRLSAAAAVGLAVLYPVLGGVFAVVPPDGSGRIDIAPGVAMLAMLPLNGWLVWFAARGTRAPRAGAVALALTATVTAGFFLSGPVPNWLGQFHVVPLAALLVLGPRRGAVVAGLVVLAVAGSALFLPGWGIPGAAYIVSVMVWRSLVVLSLVWLTVALRRLLTAREALAAQAMQAERERIDGELDRTLRAGLEAIAARSAALAALDRGAGREVESGLESLVEESRATLAEARRLSRSYRQDSVRGQLGAAVALLADAGIPISVRVPDGPIPAGAQDAIRADLRTAVADLLTRRPSGPCELALLGRADRLRLVVRAAGGDPAPPAVVPS